MCLKVLKINRQENDFDEVKIYYSWHEHKIMFLIKQAAQAAGADPS